MVNIPKEWLKELVFWALGSISNASAAGPDGISYKLIKKVLPTSLGQGLVEEIVDTLQQGKIHSAWQQMKVVIIPKPSRDLTITKNWRLINMINCIGKIEEKVVGDQLQEARLLHHHQY